MHRYVYRPARAAASRGRAAGRLPVRRLRAPRRGLPSGGGKRLAMKAMSCARHLELRSARDLDLAAGPDHRQRIVIAVEGDAVADLVGRNHVELLALELAARVLLDIVGLGGEADDEGPLRHVGDRLDDVRRGLEFQLDRGALFLDLLLRDGHGLKIGHGRRGDEHVGIGHLPMNGRIHVARAFHVDAGHARRASASCTGPLTMVTCAPASRGGGRHRKAHFSRTAVGQIAHRIEALAGRTGGDQYISPASKPALAGGASSASASCTGSHMRPAPTSPQA